MKNISKKLEISPSKVKEALSRLVAVGLLQKKEDGYELVEADLQTTDEIPSEAVKNYNLQMIQKSKSSVESLSGSERAFSTTTVAVDSKDFEQMKKEISDFRKEFDRRWTEKLNQRNYKADQVFCMTLGLFPLTSENKGKNNE